MYWITTEFLFYNAQRSCRRKRAGNFVDTVRNQKDSPRLPISFDLDVHTKIAHTFFHSCFALPDQNDVLCRVQFCFPNPNNKKSQHTLAIKIARAAGFKIFCAFPPPRNGLSSSGLASHHREAFSMTGGGLFRAHKYHRGKGRQAGSISTQDPIEIPH